jgi:hypothetical protein
MTEIEWLTSTDYLAMLIYLRGDVVQAEHIKQWMHCDAGRLAAGEADRASGRKLGLVAIEMCHEQYTLPLEGATRRLLMAYEKLANHEITWDDVKMEMPNTPLGVGMLGAAKQ